MPDRLISPSDEQIRLPFRMGAAPVPISPGAERELECRSRSPKL